VAPLPKQRHQPGDESTLPVKARCRSLQLNAQFYDAVRLCRRSFPIYGNAHHLITSDPHGALLSVDGDRHLTTRRDHIVPGAARERTSGTNAVGAALALGGRAATRSTSAVAKPWSCTAAVIQICSTSASSA
jgi:hypothetical protein